MQKFGESETRGGTASFGARRYGREGRSETVERDVPAEVLLSICVEGGPTLQLNCTGSFLEELAVGRLFTGGVIESAEDVASVRVDEGAGRIDVRLSSCGTLDEGGLAPVTPIPWDIDQVFAMADAFTARADARKRTWGTHSVTLWRDGVLLCCREDIGRHNALDKVIGFGLLNGVDFTQCALYTSGRVPVDVVLKAIRARIPLLVSKALATDKTIELARRYDLTLICDARGDAVDVFNDPR